MCSCLQFIGTSVRVANKQQQKLSHFATVSDIRVYIISSPFLLFNIIFFLCLSWCRRSRRCVVGIVVFVILSILYTYFRVDVCRCYTVSLCEFVFVFCIIDARIVSDDALGAQWTTPNKTDSDWKTFGFCRSSLPCDETGSFASSPSHLSQSRIGHAQDEEKCSPKSKKQIKSIDASSFFMGPSTPLNEFGNPISSHSAVLSHAIAANNLFCSQCKNNIRYLISNIWQTRGISYFTRCVFLCYMRVLFRLLSEPYLLNFSSRARQDLVMLMFQCFNKIMESIRGECRRMSKLEVDAYIFTVSHSNTCERSERYAPRNMFE